MQRIVVLPAFVEVVVAVAVEAEAVEEVERSHLDSSALPCLYKLPDRTEFEVPLYKIPDVPQVLTTFLELMELVDLKPKNNQGSENGRSLLQKVFEIANASAHPPLLFTRLSDITSASSASPALHLRTRLPRGPMLAAWRGDTDIHGDTLDHQHPCTTISHTWEPPPC
ncbi:hypothetical protein C8J56DRAFT_883812 [Mycena floridula]|nr:hypothetical protein C8J56DRAFT_883778 [Mycena floridula]KAJ7595625.1 hypothetical protein C8J56DRAFT_883812 [Mycena floridula]